MNERVKKEKTHRKGWIMRAAFARYANGVRARAEVIALVGLATGLSVFLTACPPGLEFRRGYCLPYNTEPIELSGPHMMVRGWAPKGDQTAIFVADYATNRVAAVSARGDTLIRHFGTGCSGACTLKGPTGVAVGPYMEFMERPDTDPPATFRLYVSDSQNDRVVEFDEDGEMRRTWGANGGGNGQFHRPYGIALDFEGRVFVVDSGNNRVQVFDTTGQYLTSWGGEGSDSGQFRGPFDIAVGVNGDLSTKFVAVSDNGNGRVQVFRPDGTLLKIINGLGDVRGICVMSDTATRQVEAVSQKEQRLYDLAVEKGTIRQQYDLKGSHRPVDVLPLYLIADESNGGVCVYGYFEKE